MSAVKADVNTVDSDLELDVDHGYYHNTGQNIQGSACNLWDLTLGGWSDPETEDTGSLVHNAVASDVELHRPFWLMDTREAKVVSEKKKNVGPPLIVYD